MHLALFDCDDSFTMNLYDLFRQCHVDVSVIHYESIPKDLSKFDAFILPPGPKSPNEIPQILELIGLYYFTKPILGICLGHQALGQYFGHKISFSKNPLHGISAKILLNEDAIFLNLPSDEFYAMRYNSLTVEENSASDLMIICHDENNEIMGFKHKSYSIYSFQFHPESIGTPFGKILIENWLRLLASSS